MKSNNLRAIISFRNTEVDFKIYAHLQTKRDKSSYIKELIEKDMEKKEQ